MEDVLINIAISAKNIAIIAIFVSAFVVLLPTFGMALFIGYGHIRRLGYPPPTSAGFVLGVAAVAILIPIATAMLVPGPENLWGGVGLTLLCIGMATTILGLGCRILISRLPKREFRISGRRRVGFPFAFFGYLLIVVVIAGVVLLWMTGPPETRTVANFFSLLSAALTLAVGGKALINVGKRIKGQVAIEDVARSDPRPPVLFLRPFVADPQPFVQGFSSKYGKYSNEAQQATTLLRSMADAEGNRRDEDPIISIPFEMYLGPAFRERIGPLIALGNPEDYLPPDGAIRTYAEDEGWYEYFERLARRAGAVVMPLSSSDNLRKELTFLVREGLQRRLFVFTPLFQPTDTQAWFPWFQTVRWWILSRGFGLIRPTEAATDWTQIGKELAGLGFELGPDPGRGAVITFDSEGKAIVLRTGADTPLEFVEPVREHLERTFGPGLVQVAQADTQAVPPVGSSQSEQASV